MSSVSQHFQPASARPHPIRALALPAIGEHEPEWLKDLRLFATGWVAGLIFFGTLLA